MTTVETVLQGFGVRSDQGTLGFCGVYLLRDNGRNLLVDVGHMGRRVLLMERLKELGLSREDIHGIVLTHAHWDHCLNVDIFPNARIMLSAREREYTRNPHVQDWATPPWTAAVLDRHPVDEVREGDEIATNTHVLEVPGHSPGSLAVLVQTPDGIVGLTGDALPNSASLTAGICYLVFWSEEEARRSVGRIAERCDVVYPGHDRAFRIQNGTFHYIEKTSIGFSGLPQMPDGQPSFSVGVGAPAAVTINPSATRAVPSSD